MTAQTILWIYIGLLVGGGIMGFVKGGSKASLITSVAFAIPLILCEFDVLPFHFAKWILLVLLVVFAWRFSKTRKFMPMGLLLVLTLAALAGLWAQSNRWSAELRLGTAIDNVFGQGPMTNDECRMTNTEGERTGAYTFAIRHSSFVIFVDFVNGPARSELAKPLQFVPPQRLS